MSDVQVTQAARDAASAAYYDCYDAPPNPLWMAAMENGDHDHDELVQAFARFEQDIIDRLATRPVPVGEPDAWMYTRAVFETVITDYRQEHRTREGWTETPLYTRPALDVDGLVEVVAREIDPTVWENYDRTLHPFIENRGAHSSIDDPISYEMMWKDGCRTVEDAKLWWMTTDRPVMVRQERWRASLVKATAALAAIKDATDAGA